VSHPTRVAPFTQTSATGHAGVAVRATSPAAIEVEVTAMQALPTVPTVPADSLPGTRPCTLPDARHCPVLRRALRQTAPALLTICLVGFATGWLAGGRPPVVTSGQRGISDAVPRRNRMARRNVGTTW
jgi:hypothetical protein